MSSWRKAESKAALLLYCGRVFAQLERWNQAIAALQESLSLNENNSDTILYLGTALAVLERWDEAGYYLGQVSAEYITGAAFFL